MKPMDVFDKMAILDDEMIDAATLPESAATPTRAGGIRHRLAELSDFFNRPAVVAAACVLVSFGVLSGIIAAGQLGGNYKDSEAVSPEDGRPSYSQGNSWLDGNQTESERAEAATENVAADENMKEEDSNHLDGPGSSAGVNPPAEDVSGDVFENEPETCLPDVEPSVPTVVIKVAAGNRGTSLHQYVVAYSGTVITADGQEVSMEMDGPGARNQLESLEMAAVDYEGALTVTLPLSCTPRDWVMYNEDFVVLDQSENFDKLPDAVALMNGPMEGRESHSVYIVLAVDYKGGQNRGIFEYAFRVWFGDSEEGTWGADTTPVYPEYPSVDTTPVDTTPVDTTPVNPEEDSTIANEGWGEEDGTIPNEGWGEDTPETDRPLEETSVSWEDDKVITPSETLKMIADGERSVYPYAHLVYVGSRDEYTGEWVSDSRPTFDRWAPENAPNYINELPMLTWAGYELELALRFEDRMKVNNLRAYHTDLTYIDTVYDAAELKILPTGRYIVIAEVHRQEVDEEFIYEHVFILERE